MIIRQPAKATFGWLCGIGILALVAAACGGDGDDGGTPTASLTRGASPTRTSGASASASPVTTDVAMEVDEWAIRPDQTRARPGTVNFLITNAGEVAHEFVVIRSDLPVAELPRLPEDTGVDESDLDIIGRLDEPVQPGAEAELSVDLAEGDYILICNLAPNGESHYLNGMYTAFEVRSNLPLSTPDETPTPSP